MGRSVSRPTDSVSVAYQSVLHHEDEYDWENFKEWVTEQALERWPSFEVTEDKWLGNEERVLLENAHAQIGVSEYCGLAAIWLRTLSDDHLSGCYPESQGCANLADAWCNRIAENFYNTFSEYRKLGTFSNGEAIYEKIKEVA